MPFKKSGFKKLTAKFDSFPAKNARSMLLKIAKNAAKNAKMNIIFSWQITAFLTLLSKNPARVVNI